jgi:hypothetical protein
MATSRASRDLDLESGMRSKAGRYTPDALTVDVRDGAIFRNGFMLICPVHRTFKNNPLPI